MQARPRQETLRKGDGVAIPYEERGPRRRRCARVFFARVYAPLRKMARNSDDAAAEVDREAGARVSAEGGGMRVLRCLRSVAPIAMLLIAACLNGVARSNAEAQGRAALHHWQDLHGDGYVRARACIACSDRPRLIGRSGRAAGIGRAAQDQGLGCSKQFMAALTEVAFKQLEATGRDLELFARCVPAPRCVPCNDVADDVLATPWSMQARETVDHYDGRRQAVHAPERSPCPFPKCRHIAAQSAAAAHGAVSPPVRVFYLGRTASWTGLQRRWRGPRTRRLPRPRRRGKARPRAKPRRCTPTTAARRTPTTMPGTLARSERHESHEAPRPRFPGVLDGALLGGALVSPRPLSHGPGPVQYSVLSSLRRDSGRRGTLR